MTYPGRRSIGPVSRITVHESARTHTVRAALVAALRARRVDNRFHYIGDLAARRWRALAASHSPAQDAGDGLGAYAVAARAAIAALPPGPVHVIGIACGDGVKEQRLLGAMQSAGAPDLAATPMDLSVPLVTAAAEAMAAVPGVRVPQRVACDLGGVADLSLVIGPREPGVRVVTLFGVVSTLGPTPVNVARSLLAPGDVLLVSANLLPDHPGARDQVMVQYDNAPTREWLRTVLDEVGIPAGAGPIEFSWEGHADIQAIHADVVLERDVTARLGGEQVQMAAGERVRILESYRHSPAALRAMLDTRGLQVLKVATSPSGEEGVAVAALARDQS